MSLKIDPSALEEVAKDLYIRALKVLPPDIKEGLSRLERRESGSTARSVLGTMVRNIAVAEETDNLLCQDTGIPIYNVTIGRGVEVDGYAMLEAIRQGCARATREYPLRSSVVHPLTRKNEHTSCGIGVPVIHVEYGAAPGVFRIEMVPKGSGSENGSFLRMAIPAEGIDAIKTFVIDCVLAAGGKTCPPTIVGVGLGLLAGFRGGWIDTVLMRLCDVMLSFPAILVALLIAGVGRALFPDAHEGLAFGVLIMSISLTGWVQYARTVRGSTLVERSKEYVQAARVTGVAPVRIMLRHVLPNVLGPVLVLATIQVATAIITEATLSFLGVGVPPTSPSLGTLIRVGNDYLFSGEWWITIFPGLMLVLIALSVNLLGDWLRDALNPRLR
mgnify:CR=1 FL=1